MTDPIAPPSKEPSVPDPVPAEDNLTPGHDRPRPGTNTLRWLPIRVWFRLLKRYAPTSLWARSFLIIVLPVALMQIAVTWVFFDAHWKTVNTKLSASLAGDVAWIVDTYKRSPNAETLSDLALRAERDLQLSVTLQPNARLPIDKRPNLLEILETTLVQALDERVDAETWIDTTRYAAYVDIRVVVPGGVLRILAPRDRAFTPQAHIFVLWLAGATVSLTLIAILFIRNQVRSIERLADAAESFGRGEDISFKPHGAQEVRRAAHAFLDMKERISRFMDQRTAMLASVSHDLRTPLTRLKLELALATPSGQITAMKGDLAEMEHMIDEYLAFARGEAGEPTLDMDLSAFLHGLIQDARRVDHPVDERIEPSLMFRGRPMALKRAFSNLISNAHVHGNKILVTARQSPGPQSGFDITVEDDGPGIAPNLREEAFKPFSRLDPARNQNIKGAGLGLAITRDVIHSHGGTIRLDTSDLGGLCARIHLPA